MVSLTTIRIYAKPFEAMQLEKDIEELLEMVKNKRTRLQCLYGKKK